MGPQLLPSWYDDLVRASLQWISACLALMVVLFIFTAPVLDLESTAMRARQLAESLLLGLAFLASVLVGRLFLVSPLYGLSKHLKTDTVPRKPSPILSSLCFFRC